jgi:hypothetical protein
MAADSSASAFTLVVDLWSWPEIVREVQNRIIAFGVRRRRIETRWKGLRIELEVEVEGTEAQLAVFSRFIDSLSG